MITIHNLHNEDCVYEYDIRVDRASKLGNPFRMFNESERDEVCNDYEEYFADMTNKSLDNYEIYRKYQINDREREAFMNELRKLYKIHRQYGRLRLFCWCYPKRCHAKTIKKFLEKYIK